MKVYAYLRVSTEQQTLLQQQNAINDYLKLKGLQIDEIVSDEGVSGGVSYKQRKLNDLLSEMKEGDSLVVSEISRLGRSMSDLNKLVNDELKPKKLRLIVISMGLDLDCANLKAIDEMILFAFSFSSQIEKEMIQERTRNALDARKKILAEKGFFISKAGNKVTRLGGNADTVAARKKSIEVKKQRAKENKSNRFLWSYLKDYQADNGKLTANTPKDRWEELVVKLNNLGATTATGLEFNVARLKAMYEKLKNLYLYGD